MYLNGKWGALVGTLVMLWGCGGSESNGTPTPGGTGTCQVSGGMTVQVPVNALAGPNPSLGGINIFTILTYPANQANDVVTGNFHLGSTAFVTGHTYTLSEGEAQTFITAMHGPVATRTQWIAGSMTGKNPTNGTVALTLTSVGSVAHGTLVATLKPQEPPTGADVTVNCTF